MLMKRYLLLLSFILFLLKNNYSQEVYQNLTNSAVYEFLDELANDQVIDLHSAIKPYSRIFIAEKLKEASSKQGLLDKRQKAELEFYLLDFSKELKGFETIDFIGKNLISKTGVPFKKRTDLFYYKDSLFTFTANLVLGISYFSNKNGTNYHRWNGAEAYANIGRHWGIYASLRDNHESELFALSNYLTLQQGGTYKIEMDGGGDYEAMKGGISYSWNWGSIGIIQDNISWGNNYHGSNIISNRAPSFPMIKLHAAPVKWFDFNYIHGWLSSDVIDSLRTYSYGSGNRLVYHAKFIAANMFTFTPFKRLDLSFGNSIIYSDMGVNPAYLIPVMFFKAIDHSQDAMNNFAGQNAQMFFDISSRQIRHLHLYSSFFVDEINIGNMWDKNKQSNFISVKGGFALSDLPLQNITLIGEYTHTNPIAYKHFIPTTTFETNLYNMGHYLRDNAEEYFVALNYSPIRGLSTQASYTFAQKGPDYPYTGIGGSGLGLPFMASTLWFDRSFSFGVRYQVFNDIFVFAHYTNSYIKDILKIYSPGYFQGNTNTINVGMNWGF
jgi:hypothetical protein